MTIILSKKCYASNIVHAYLISVSTIRWYVNTHRENLIQYKSLKNKILAPFDIFGVFTQFKFYNSIKTRDV